MKTTTPALRGLDEYSIDRLRMIRADLEKNPDSKKFGTWEANRLIAISSELRKREAKEGK